MDVFHSGISQVLLMVSDHNTSILIKRSVQLMGEALMKLILCHSCYLPLSSLDFRFLPPVHRIVERFSHLENISCQFFYVMIDDRCDLKSGYCRWRCIPALLLPQDSGLLSVLFTRAMALAVVNNSSFTWILLELA